MYDGGYFPLWRKIRSWAWYKDSNTKALFLELLLRASFDEADFRDHKLSSGQCIMGRQEMAKTLGISERQVRTALKHLKATSDITVETFNKYSVITLNNYSKYQKVTNKRPASDQQVTTYNNDKNVKKDIYCSVLTHLNSLLDTSYKPSTGKTRELIQARLNEGFTADDFKTVHKKMVKAWGKDEKMRQFLRPQTLYSNKFESYLNRKEEAPKPHEHRKKNDERYKKTMARLDKEKKERLREISKTIGK